MVMSRVKLKTAAAILVVVLVVASMSFLTKIWSFIAMKYDDTKYYIPDSMTNRVLVLKTMEDAARKCGLQKAKLDPVDMFGTLASFTFPAGRKLKHTYCDAFVTTESYGFA